jgi:hypothetical protein
MGEGIGGASGVDGRVIRANREEIGEPMEAGLHGAA